MSILINYMTYVTHAKNISCTLYIFFLIYKTDVLKDNF